MKVDLDCYNDQCSISLVVCRVDGYRPSIRYCHLISWLCTQSGTDVLSNSVFAVSMAVAHIFNAAIQSNGYIHNQRKSDWPSTSEVDCGWCPFYICVCLIDGYKIALSVAIIADIFNLSPKFFYSGKFWSRVAKTCRPCRPVGANFPQLVLIFGKACKQLCHCPMLISLIP